ncbi:MAG: hypothetical protein M1833_007101 [Piccolia ochrophora]|nr:MAG: hypothetical protein M1833_007101 [Piccolia ochrophora]
MQSPASGGRLTLDEHYNEPLKRHIWTSKRQWTRQQLDREREEFFDTRVTGRPETWSAIRVALETMETDLGTAQTILDAAGVTLPTGDLINGAYDDVGNFYQLPEQCISDPLNIVDTSSTRHPRKNESDLSETDEDEALRRREEKGKTVIQAEHMYSVKARLSDRGGPDVQVGLGKGQTVRVLAQKVQEEAGIIGRNKVRIAYMGKILKEGEPLQAQGWREGHVVNALVF